tara:strand:- start:6080 stop:6274 length:195 start_codon:yes stop_codon:yes gene_type:complete
MKVGDLVKYETDKSWKCDDISTGIIVAELPADRIIAAAVSVLWASGELVERVPSRILAVINASR